MKRFAIFGASGCGRSVLPLVRQQLQVDLAACDADLVFVDDHPPAPVVNGQRVLTYAQWLSEPASSRHMNVAIANSRVREQLVQRCAADGVQFFEARAANVVQLDDVQLILLCGRNEALAQSLRAMPAVAPRVVVGFTGTPALINSFRRLGIALHRLAPADPARLGVDRDEWGSYYDAGPQVMVAEVPGADRTLATAGTYRQFGASMEAAHGLCG